MDLIHHLGSLALGSRLKRLSDRFMTEAAQIYAAQDIAFEPRWFPLFSLLADQQSLSTGEAAKALRLSHAAISQTAREMIKHDVLIAHKDKSDERRTQLSLTPRGKHLLTQLRPLWSDIRASIDDVTLSTGVDIISTLSRLERALDEQSLASRTQSRLRARELETVSIIDFQPQHKDAFSQLNTEWIQKYFTLEQADIDLFANPKKHILDAGGHILFAQLNDTLVGTVALLKRPHQTFELAKMAVSPAAQGKHIGKKLLLSAIESARSVGASNIFLETNDSLTPAVNLYRSVGFLPDPTPREASKYSRCNLVMSLKLQPADAKN